MTVPRRVDGYDTPLFDPTRPAAPFRLARVASGSPRPRAGSNCDQCSVRHKMQQKYLAEAHELYDDGFHLVLLPLLTEEVRGVDRLREFSKVCPYGGRGGGIFGANDLLPQMLITPYTPAAE